MLRVRVIFWLICSSCRSCPRNWLTWSSALFKESRCCISSCSHIWAYAATDNTHTRQPKSMIRHRLSIQLRIKVAGHAETTPYLECRSANAGAWLLLPLALIPRHRVCRCVFLFSLTTSRRGSPRNATSGWTHVRQPAFIAVSVAQTLSRTERESWILIREETNRHGDQVRGRISNVDRTEIQS